MLKPQSEVLSEDDESGSENNVIPFKTAADADVEEGEDAAGSEDGEEYDRPSSASARPVP